MIVNYTVLYFTMLLFNNLVTVVSPSYARIAFTILREFYLVAIAVLFIQNIVNKGTVKKNIGLMLKLSFAFILMNIFYLIISPNTKDGAVNLILYCSGPYIFALVSGIEFSHTAINKFRTAMNKVLLIYIVLSALIFVWQDRIYAWMGLEYSEYWYNLFRFKVDESIVMRFCGLAMHPTLMGATIMVYASNMLFFNRGYLKLAVLAFLYYLTDTRSLIMGLPLCIYVTTRIRKKYFAMLIILATLLVIATSINDLVMTLDKSVEAHYIDFVMEGPKAAIKYWYGIGLGMVSPYTNTKAIIHIESDLFLAIIQTGIVTVLIYTWLCLVVFRHIYKAMEKGILANQCKYVLFIFIMAHAGSLFLSVFTIRFLMNIVWFEAGLLISQLYSLKPREEMDVQTVRMPKLWKGST